MGFLFTISLLGKIYDIRYFRSFVFSIGNEPCGFRKFHYVLYGNLDGE